MSTLPLKVTLQEYSAVEVMNWFSHLRYVNGENTKYNHFTDKKGVDSATTSVVFTYDVKFLVGQGGERDLEENLLSRIAECGKERNTLGKCR